MSQYGNREKDDLFESIKCGLMDISDDPIERLTVLNEIVTDVITDLLAEVKEWAQEIRKESMKAAQAMSDCKIVIDKMYKEIEEMK